MLIKKGIDYLHCGDYGKAIIWYEQEINDNPNTISHYWYLGLSLLLAGREEEAQTTWLWAMAEGESTEIAIWTEELIGILGTEADRLALLEEYAFAWTIRQHIRELTPDNINNLLRLVDLSITLNHFSVEDIRESNLISQLQDKSKDIDSDLLLHILKKVLLYPPCISIFINFAQVSCPHIYKNPSFLPTILPVIYEIAYSWKVLTLAKQLAEIFLEFSPHSRELLRTLSQFCTDLSEHDQAIHYAEICYELSEELFEKIIDSHGLMRAVMAAKGYSQQIIDLAERHKQLLNNLIASPPNNIGMPAMRLYNTCFFFPYIQDKLAENLQLRSQVAQVCQSILEKSSQAEYDKYRQGLQERKQARILSDRPLRIGYISHTMRKHSVGWLARWLFQYHDRGKFQVYSYMLGSEHHDDILRQWYIEKSFKAYTYGTETIDIPGQIYDDEIDILIDLDSVTLTNTAFIIALKPAPIIVTWLGWDASCMPTVDYYIADPYVLPEGAEAYYPEKIYRLPETYLAVDGFEVHEPTLRRDQLNIPADSVIYLAAQRCFKYNPDILRLQMKIIQAVPNSYFLVKGFGNETFFIEALKSIGESEGVSPDRLRFIDEVALEEIHRANLGIADIVLDTYPYNGATTTMETLWMGIPLVTKVGEQFSARNSYTMMINAGITEGIAWNDEEYVEWGIKLGQDENLRKEVSWKLKQNRQTAPLWDSEKFTHEMEKAYQQMWQNYMETK
jgi:predicted O-linked N-acetylglucosamine transferase (SPINDLY family)